MCSEEGQWQQSRLQSSSYWQPKHVTYLALSALLVIAYAFHVCWPEFTQGH